MHKLISTIKETIEREKLISKEGSKIIVAISGGADSLALLMALSFIGYEVIAAHCNFHLRGRESDEDEFFVRDICKAKGIKLERIDFDTTTFAKKESISIEMAARHLRYEWFTTLSASYGNIPIAIAHNSDDNIETFMLNLASGTGIRGLRGMPYKRNDIFIRPLLDCSRSLILDYLDSISLSYRHDSSNDDTKYKRNLIRHELLPIFEKLNTSFRSTMLSNIEIMGFVEKIYNEKIDSHREKAISNGKIDMEYIWSTNEKDRDKLLFELLKNYNFSYDVVKDILQNREFRGLKTYYSPTHRILSNRRFWEILPNQTRHSFEETININQIDTKDLADIFLSWHIEDFSPNTTLKTKDTEAIFDYDKLISGDANIIISTRKDGDYIEPYGMNGKKKKVSRVLIDQKLSNADREKILLLKKGEKTLWIIGIKADSRLRVSDSTKKIIRFKVEYKH